MKTLASRLLVGSLFVALYLSCTQNAVAQNIDGIMNLMGRAIEHDIRRKQQQRQQEYEYQRQRAYEEQEQARRQAEIDAVREQEIALVKREQAALTSLGFLTTVIDGDRGPATRQAEASYAAAFRLQGFNLTEASVQQLEQYAAQGYRSLAEYQRSAAGKFGSRAEMIAAEAAGFANAAEFAEAKRQGFEQKSEYEAFRASGLANRAEFRKSREQAAKRDSSRKTCLSASKSATASLKEVEGCLVAIQLGVNDPEFNMGLRDVESKLATKEAELVRLRNTAAPQVAAKGNTALPKPAASANLGEQAQIAAALKATRCGLAYQAMDYDRAIARCAATPSDPLGSIQLALSQDATAKVKLAEMEARKEQERLALDNAKARAAELIDQLQRFTASQGKLVAPVDVAKALIAVRRFEAASATEVQQANQALETFLTKEPAFQSFLQEQKTAKQVAAANAKATAADELKKVHAFLIDYISKNILDKNLSALVELQAKVEEAESSHNDDLVIRQQRLSRDQIASFGLQAAFESFKSTYQSIPKSSDVAVVQNGLAITILNKELLVGDDRDVIVLGNFTPNAPHLFVNLVGKTTFDQRTAAVCWYGSKGTNSASDLGAIQKVHEAGVDTVTGGEVCPIKEVGRQDLVVLRRSELLASNPTDASVIVQAFEKRNFRVLSIVAWKDVGEAAERDDALSKSIETDVVGGTRIGFGAIAISAPSKRLCLVVAAKDTEMHTLALSEPQKGLERLVRPNEITQVDGAERAFVFLQRQQCAAVYAKHDDLKVLIEGLKRLHSDYSVIPLWVSEEDLASAAAKVDQAQTSAQQGVAARKQAIEGQERLAAQKDQDEAKVRERKQAQLRDQYGQQAAAAFNGLSDSAKQFVQTTSDGSEFPRLFPNVARWQSERLKDRWEVETVLTEPVDYGTAGWSGRRLEAVVINVNVRLKNRQLGQYASECFTLGYLIDSEFAALRDPMEVRCGEASNVTDWKKGRTFESRWLVAAP